MSEQISGKAWRQDPRILSLQPVIVDFRPFGTVAAIFTDRWVYVGMSRCMPIDTFDAAMGEQRAAGRARLLYALCLGLLPKTRATRIGRRESAGGSLMLRLTPEQFAARFAMVEIVALAKEPPAPQGIWSTQGASAKNHAPITEATPKRRTPVRVKEKAALNIEPAHLIETLQQGSRAAKGNAEVARWRSATARAEDVKVAGRTSTRTAASRSASAVKAAATRRRNAAAAAKKIKKSKKTSR